MRGSEAIVRLESKRLQRRSLVVATVVSIDVVFVIVAGTFVGAGLGGGRCSRLKDFLEFLRSSGGSGLCSRGGSRRRLRCVEYITTGSCCSWNSIGDDYRGSTLLGSSCRIGGGGCGGSRLYIDRGQITRLMGNKSSQTTNELFYLVVRLQNVGTGSRIQDCSIYATTNPALARHQKQQSNLIPFPRLSSTRNSLLTGPAVLALAPIPP